MHKPVVLKRWHMKLFMAVMALLAVPPIYGFIQRDLPWWLWALALGAAGAGLAHMWRLWVETRPPE